MADWDHSESANSYHADVAIDPDLAGATDTADAADSDQPPTENVEPSGPSGVSTQHVAEKGWSERTPFTYADYISNDFTEWAGSAKRYEWSDEYGDVGPKNEELEKQLFNLDNMTQAGMRLDRYVP
jgi:ATP-dependent RNA helicase DDX3X